MLNETAQSLGVSRVLEAQRRAYEIFKRDSNRDGASFSAADIIQYHYYRKLRTDNSSDHFDVIVSPSGSVLFNSN